MKKTSQIILLVFLFCALMNLWSEFQNWRLGILLSKPLLMSTLGIYFWLRTKENKTKFSFFILLGLILSIFGDSFLMFQNQGNHFFLLGLSSFLLTHLFYVVAFLKYPSNKKGLVKRQPILVIPVLIFLIGNSWFLWEGLSGSLKIPVLVYSSVISGMILCAINLNGKLSKKAFQTILFGALLFMVSDTIIGITKFGGDTLQDTRMLIMPTYILGQYLIVKGAILANNELN